MSIGLRDVSTEDLKKMFRLVVKKVLSYPVTPVELARTGLQHCQEPLLSTLRGLDGPAVQAVLTSVIAERLPRY